MKQLSHRKSDEAIVAMKYGKQYRAKGFSHFSEQQLNNLPEGGKDLNECTRNKTGTDHL